MIALLKLFWKEIVVVAALLFACWWLYHQGVKHEAARGALALQALHTQYADAIEQANDKADVQARAFEKWKRDNRPKADKVTKDTDDAIKAAPEWSDVPLPVGVRNALTAAPAILGASESDGTVSPVQPASPID